MKMPYGARIATSVEQHEHGGGGAAPELAALEHEVIDDERGQRGRNAGAAFGQRAHQVEGA